MSKLPVVMVPVLRTIVFIPDAVMPAELSPVVMMPSLTLMPVRMVRSSRGSPRPATVLPMASSPTVMLPLLRAYAVVPATNGAILFDINPMVSNTRSNDSPYAL